MLIKCVPTIHPASVLRQWDQRALVLSDLRRAKKALLEGPIWNPPAWNFRIRPSFSTVMEVLNDLLRRIQLEEIWIDFDLETSLGHIACAGISWSRLDALCIPFWDHGKDYWTLDEEAQIIFSLYHLLTHKNVKVRWQNGLYDAQYTYRHWHFIPRGAQDTMISQHALFVALPKGLGFLGSMYSDWYIYWKEEGKNIDGKLTPERGWAYNCQDCVYTREVGEIQLEIAEKMGMKEVHDFQQKLFWPVLKAMIRGMRIREEVRAELAMEIQEEISKREQFLLDIFGHPINVSSPLQMKELFYSDLSQAVIMSRPKKGMPSHPTCDDEAMQKIATREPLLRPIVNAITDIRTLGVLLATFVLAKADVDGRMRCSYNIGGNAGGKSAPYTFRLSSSKNAFDTGANLMNIPSDKSKAVGKSTARGKIVSSPDAPIAFALPNMRSMYGPDPGFTYFDMDLDRADMQVMAWDADEPILKIALKKKVDLHLLNVYIIDGEEPPPMEELVETHPKYPDHRGPRKLKREFSKVFAHATDYLGKSRTVAAATGRTVHEVDRAQKIYLSTYSGIKKWQDRVIEQVRKRRFVENAFGYRWHIFDRIDDSVMPEAVAWIPQSTVAVIINKAWVNIDENLPEVQVQGQVHDSLVGQGPTHRKHIWLPELERQSLITVPYADPLVIPVGIKTSEISWGDCQ